MPKFKIGDMIYNKTWFAIGLANQPFDQEFTTVYWLDTKTVRTYQNIDLISSGYGILE